MELEELKKTWDNQSNAVPHQILTVKIVDQLAQIKYNRKIKSIAYAEITGGVICLMAIVFIGLHFHKLNTHLLQGVGVLSILILPALSIISFLSLQKLKMTSDFNKPYAETLKIFANKKLAFFKLQKFNITLCYLLLVAVIILVSKFFSGKDVTGNKYFWLFSFTIGYIFLLFYSRFVTRFYQNTLRKSEELLQELQP